MSSKHWPLSNDRCQGIIRTFDFGLQIIDGFHISLFLIVALQSDSIDYRFCHLLAIDICLCLGIDCINNFQSRSVQSFGDKGISFLPFQFVRAALGEDQNGLRSKKWIAIAYEAGA